MSDASEGNTLTPGHVMAQLLESRGWSQQEFAGRMGYTLKHVRDLMNGRAAITAETAMRLESVLGESAQWWLGQEMTFRQQSVRRDSAVTPESIANWLKDLPLKQMINWGWVERRPTQEEQAKACLQFFSVGSLAAWHEMYSKPVESLAAFRAASARAMRLGAVAAWLRKGEMEASAIRARPWNKLTFKVALTAIRELTKEPEPERFLPELEARCADSGVAFVHLRTPEGCPVNGATRFLTADKAMLLLSFRHLRDDVFWFSFFHEAAHLILHPERTILEVPAATSAQEHEASSFAEEVLIPEPERHRLRMLNSPSRILAFARRIGISPGLVLGQLHHHGLVPPNRFLPLLTRYRWNEPPSFGGA